MANIAARGYPAYVDGWTEGDPGREFTVWSFRLWCRTEEGKTYRRYVDIASKLVDPTQPPKGGWPADVVEVLYRSQLALEKNPDAYSGPIVSAETLAELEQDAETPWPSIVEGFKQRENKEWQDVADWASDFDLPSDPDNPEREHSGGPAKCWCGRTHPPHKEWQADCRSATVCWCRVRHCGIGHSR